MGEVFAGRYELVDPIGRGGAGAVWRAWDHRRRRYVAAKVLQQSDAHTLLRFVREQALRIDHPHVLAPASWAADDDKVLFTMDLVKGGSLAHVIGDYGPLAPRFVCTLLDQLLSGLTAVHAEGVVHRDIKPANILLEATGTGRPHLRLSDFGIAMRKGEPRLTETDYVVGTPGYFAPEQMLGDEPDFPGDLFAVGLVALYLLEGAKPDSKALIQHFAAHGTPDAPQGIPEPLWQVLATLLQPDPDARFRTATGARKALSSAVELLPEPGPDDEIVEIFDQLGPLPPGFIPEGPLKLGTAPPPPVPAVPPPVSSRTDDFHLSPPTGRPTPPPAPVPPAPLTPPQPSTPPTPMPTHAPTPARLDDDGGGAPSTDSASRAVSGSASGSGPGSTSGPGPGSTSGPRPGSTSGPGPGSTSGPGPGSTSGPVTPPAAAPPPAPSPPGPQTGAPTPSPVTPTPAPLATASPQDPYGYTPTRPYTAQNPHGPAGTTPSGTTPSGTTPSGTTQVPQQPQPMPPPTAAAPAPPAVPAPAPAPEARSAARQHRRKRRPGPPLKVTVPVLLLALVSYAVGFWALSRL